MTRQDASADVPVAPATLLTHADTAGLGVLHIDHPDGAFGPSIATRIAVRCIGQHRDLLRGVGVDWGCGPGTLAIAAARIPDVTDVFGLDVNPINVAAAAVNAVVNGVSTKARFAVADSFSPVDEIAAARLAEHVGSLDFVVANPPASSGRRRIRLPAPSVGGRTLIPPPRWRGVSERFSAVRYAAHRRTCGRRRLRVLGSSGIERTRAF